jgi:acetyl-CoA carboxylase carboxyl transferase subunit beta
MKLREELIRITRMLLGLSPVIAGDLPAPEPATPEASPPLAQPGDGRSQPT